MAFGVVRHKSPSVGEIGEHPTTGSFHTKDAIDSALLNKKREKNKKNDEKKRKKRERKYMSENKRKKNSKREKRERERERERKGVRVS